MNAGTLLLNEYIVGLSNIKTKKKRRLINLSIWPYMAAWSIVFLLVKMAAEFLAIQLRQ